MAEEEQPAATTADNGAQRLEIRKLYLKDASFESPQAPRVFTESWQPQTRVELSSEAQAIEESFYEVVLTLTLTATAGDKTVYVVEVQQAGLFALGGFSEAQLGSVLGSYCPSILFPFAREAIADLAGKGGFPQILLAPVNFDAIYAQQQRHQQDAGDAATH